MVVVEVFWPKIPWNLGPFEHQNTCSSFNFRKLIILGGVLGNIKTDLSIWVQLYRFDHLGVLINVFSIPRDSSFPQLISNTRKSRPILTWSQDKNTVCSTSDDSDTTNLTVNGNDNGRWYVDGSDRPRQLLQQQQQQQRWVDGGKSRRLYTLCQRQLRQVGHFSDDTPDNDWSIPQTPQTATP